jgi:ketosteroid isomerase-like protein
MPIRKASFVSIMLLTMVGSVQVQSSSGKALETVEETKREILQREGDQNEALRTNDAARLGAMCADELAWTNASGILLAKEEMLADMKSGKQKNFTIKHEDVRLHVYGDTVVVTGLSTSTYQYDGHQATGVRRFTNVWVRQDRKWLLVVHHVTPVAKSKTEIK